MLIIRLLLLLAFIAPLGDDGIGIDPNGGGRASSDSGGCIDPEGACASADGGGAMDPNG